MGPGFLEKLPHRNLEQRDLKYHKRNPPHLPERQPKRAQKRRQIRSQGQGQSQNQSLSQSQI